MLTIHAVPASDPVLVGTLRAHRLGRVKGRPVLTCEAWCAFCRGPHAVEWPDPPFGLECVRPLKVPCRSGPFAGREVMVGLDPDRHAEHARLVRHHAQALRRWRSEQRLRHQFAEARAIDRKHLGEGWDVETAARRR